MDLSELEKGDDIVIMGLGKFVRLNRRGKNPTVVLRVRSTRTKSGWRQTTIPVELVKQTSTFKVREVKYK
jgi:hypothetical protein